MSTNAGLVQNELRDLRGNALTGAVVKVFEAGTATLATLYNNPVAIASAGPGDLLVNDPVTGLPAAAGLLLPGVDTGANYTFYADSDEEYDLEATHQGVVFTYRVRPNVHIGSGTYVQTATPGTPMVAGAANGVATLDATGVVTPSLLDPFLPFYSVKRHAKTAAQRLAVGDGTSTPLSTYYADIAAAQVDYPHAVALTDELDWAVGQAAINSGLAYFPGGTHRVNRHFTLLANQRVMLDPATVIRQTAQNTAIFRAVQQDNVWVHCNGGVLYGEGTWSSTWTGNRDHEDRGIEFLGCTRSGVTYPTIKNMANAGIFIAGGNRITVVRPVIEGTHEYSTPLASGNNFQNGIHLENEATYGAYDNVLILAPDISNTNQGVLVTQAAGITAGEAKVVAPNIHNIRGQHGFYIAASNVHLSDVSVDTVALSGVKVQADATVTLVTGVRINGANVRNATGSNAFEIATVAAGSEITDLHAADLVARSCASGINISGKVTHSRINGATVNGATSTTGMIVQGADVDALDLINIRTNDTQQHGVIFNATGTGRINLWNLRVRNPNRVVGAAYFGVYTAPGNTTDITINGMSIQDTTAAMPYGFYHTGGTMRVFGPVRISGASAKNARGGATIARWPYDADVGDSYLAIEHFRFDGPADWKVQSTSTSNIVLWQQTLDDESAYLVRAEVVGKLAGSAERRGIVSTVVAFRDAAGAATLQGAADEDVSIASAGFAGVYTWNVSGNLLRLLVHSGAAATNVDWRARISVTKLAD